MVAVPEAAAMASYIMVGQKQSDAFEVLLGESCCAMEGSENSCQADRALRVQRLNDWPYVSFPFLSFCRKNAALIVSL